MARFISEVGSAIPHGLIDLCLHLETVLPDSWEVRLVKGEWYEGERYSITVSAEQEGWRFEIGHCAGLRDYWTVQVRCANLDLFHRPIEAAARESVSMSLKEAAEAPDPFTDATERRINHLIDKRLAELKLTP